MPRIDEPRVTPRTQPRTQTTQPTTPRAQTARPTTPPRTQAPQQQDRFEGQGDADAAPEPALAADQPDAAGQGQDQQGQQREGCKIQGHMSPPQPPWAKAMWRLRRSIPRAFGEG